MNKVHTYLNQHFPPQPNCPGANENSDAFNSRNWWFDNNFPKYREVDKHFGFKEGRSENYAKKYGWRKIRETAEEIQREQDLIDREERQKKIEAKHRNRNEIIGNAYEMRITELLQKLGKIPKEGYTPPELSEEEETEIWEEIRETRKELSKIQSDERITEHLPNSYKDVTGDFKVESQNTNINLNHELPTDAEVDELYENRFKDFIKNAIGDDGENIHQNNTE